MKTQAAATENIAKNQLDRSKLPMPEPPFRGKIGKTYEDSKSEWPKFLQAGVMSTSPSLRSVL